MFVGEDFDKAGQGFRPVFENPSGARAAGQSEMACDETFYELCFGQPRPRQRRLFCFESGRFENWLEVDRFQIAAFLGEVSALVKNVGDTATHASGEISAAGPEHQNQALGHIFAAVVADSLDYRSRSGVANRKPLARDPIEKRFTTGCAVEGNITNQNIVLGGETGPSRRIGNQASAGQPLANIIIALAFECEGNSLGQKCAHALPRRSVEMNANRIVRQSMGAFLAKRSE